MRLCLPYQILKSQRFFSPPPDNGWEKTKEEWKEKERVFLFLFLGFWPVLFDFELRRMWRAGRGVPSSRMPKWEWISLYFCRCDQMSALFLRLCNFAHSCFCSCRNFTVLFPPMGALHVKISKTGLGLRLGCGALFNRTFFFFRPSILFFGFKLVAIRLELFNLIRPIAYLFFLNL